MHTDTFTDVWWVLL